MVGFMLTGCKDKPGLIDDPHIPIDIIPDDPDDSDDPDDPDIPIEDKVIEEKINITTYASGVEFNVFTYNPKYKLPETYIDVEISEIDYSPLRQQVCFWYDIHDKEYARATYYVILQDTQRTLTRQQIVINGGQSHFSGSACVNVADLSLEYRIIIGKDDSDNLNPTYGYIKGSAWIEFSDGNKHKRKLITNKSYSNTTPEETANLKASLVSYSFEIEDLNSAIETIVVVIKDTFNNIVEAKAFTSSEIRNSENKLKVTNDIFEGLAPNVDYKIDVYAYGNDGVDDFEKAFLFRINAKSSRLMGQTSSDLVSAFHGLYAVIYEAEETDDSMIISYVYSNEDVISYGEEPEKLYLHMTLYNKDNEVLGTYPMEIGEQSVSIPIVLIEERSRIEITDQRDSKKFDIHFFGEKDPKVFPYGTENDYILKFNGDSSIVTRIDIKIFVVGYAVPIEIFENFDFKNNNQLTIYHDLSNIDKILFEFTVTYLAYGKTYTIITSETR